VAQLVSNNLTEQFLMLFCKTMCTRSICLRY